MSVCYQLLLLTSVYYQLLTAVAMLIISRGTIGRGEQHHYLRAIKRSEKQKKMINLRAMYDREF